MIRYLAAIGILILQETVLLNGLLVETQKGLYSMWVIHILFILATILDIWAGYAIGKLVQKKWPHGKFVRLGEKWSKRFHTSVGRLWRWIAIIIVGYFNFPYINGFAAAWIDESILKVFLLLFIGAILEYMTFWLIILGITKITVNPYIVIPAVVGIWFVLVWIASRIKKLSSKKF
jgi:membrane protein YqaA with SNARE-associated domain